MAFDNKYLTNPPHYFNELTNIGIFPFNGDATHANDAKATVEASGYFDAAKDRLTVGSYIMGPATDGSLELVVTAVSPAVTVESIITSADLPAGSVTKAKLAVGVKPSHMIVFSGELTTVGGAATENFTVTGALPGDFLFAQLKTEGGAPVTILTAASGTDLVTLKFSADPSTDHVFAYQVVRATS